jgi:peroxin-2
MLIATPRVTQLDAQLLDDELISHLSNQITDHKDELTVLLKLLLYKLTIGNNSQSYGMFLMNLRYKNLHTWKKHAYVLWLVLNKYLGEKLSSMMYDEDSAHSKWYKMLERGYTLLDSLNFLVFLVRGSYPNLMMRLLGIKMSYNSLELAAQKGNISYEFQNRQLIWNTFLEFILFILPILQNSQVNTIFSKLLTKPSQLKDSLDFKHLKERECAICFEASGEKQRIVSPMEASCGCKYCYVCLVTKLEQASGTSEKWKCLRCGEPVQYCIPYLDIDESAIKCVLEDDFVEPVTQESEQESDEDFSEQENYEKDYDDINDLDVDHDLEEEMEEIEEEMDEYEL